jgi:hypothetical protein
MTCLCFRNYQCLACEAGVRRAAAPQTSNRRVAECGTRAGYNRHLKQGEPTCADCKAAQSEGVKRHNREKAMANG